MAGDVFIPAVCALCRNVQESVGVCRSVQECAGVCRSAHKCAGVRKLKITLLHERQVEVRLGLGHDNLQRCFPEICHARNDR